MVKWEMEGMGKELKSGFEGDSEWIVYVEVVKM